MAAHLDFLEKLLSREHKMTIIWMHGLGDSGHGHASIPETMSFPEEMGVKFILPHAPSIPVTVNGGAVMPAWFDILEIDIERKVDEDGIEASADAIRELIQTQLDAGVPAESIVLAGFSQGGVMALHVGLSYPEKLGGIICMSTFLGLEKVVESPSAVANANTPIFWGHGTHDPVIPLSLAESSVDFLIKKGYEVQFEKFTMDHSILPQELKSIQDWLITHR